MVDLQNQRSLNENINEIFDGLVEIVIEEWTLLIEQYNLDVSDLLNESILEDSDESDEEHSD